MSENNHILAVYFIVRMIYDTCREYRINNCTVSLHAVWNDFRKEFFQLLSEKYIAAFLGSS